MPSLLIVLLLCCLPHNGSIKKDNNYCWRRKLKYVPMRTPFNTSRMSDGLLPFMIMVFADLDAITAADSFVDIPPVLRVPVGPIAPAFISSVIAVTSGISCAVATRGSRS